jgi:hypothetical protein
VIEDLETGRPGHEVDAIVAQVGVRLAGPVVEHERRRRAGDRGVDHVRREEHALTRMVEWQAVLEQPPAHLRPADLHADLRQHAPGLVDDPGDELRVEDVE